MRKALAFLRQNPHDPILTGNYLANMAVGYYPREDLERLLPRGMSIPPESVMAESYPTVKARDGMHPFMLQLATGRDVHPRVHDHDAPASYPSYREVMFYVPVLVTHGKEQQLCSYVPVLYLDYLFGVLIGNLYWGFRKQYHPRMVIEETDGATTCTIRDLFRAHFPRTATKSTLALDPFFAQTFRNPTVTVSYWHQTYFYTTRVFSLTRVLETSPVYEWNHKGSRIRNPEDTFGHYAEFTFTISKAMRYPAYFHPRDGREARLRPGWRPRPRRAPDGSACGGRTG